MSGTTACPLAVTMGEPAGIGTEITLKAWQGNHDTCAPYFLIDDIIRVEKVRDHLNIDTPLSIIETPSETVDVFKDSLPVLSRPRSGETEFGQPNTQTALSVISSIETAVQLTLTGEASGVVTNPIQKSILYKAGFEFPGHTEFLGALGGNASYPVMMLACKGLRVVPISVHVGLRQALDGLSTDLIAKQSRVTWQALRRDFSIDNPKLAIAGLNPHAGEDGAMGLEENDIILPAIEVLRAEGLDVSGPYPPDTLFTERTRKRYDAAICMYHDQALIPIKTLDFDGGVNITLGLPFIRTSPDHGTALEIAGKGDASPRSLLSALGIAGEMAECRARSSE